MNEPDRSMRSASTVELVPLARPLNADVGRRAKYLPRLREPLEQLEFVLNGTSLQRLLQRLEVPEPETYGFPEPFDLVSVVDFAWPEEAGAALRRLTGDLPRDDAFWPLEPGRLPLYVCPIDGDLGCGAVTVAVTHGSDETTWHDFRIENLDPEPSGLDMSAFGPFTFRREPYRQALLEPVGVLDAMGAEDRAAEQAYQRGRTLRGRWKRLWGR